MKTIKESFNKKIAIIIAIPVILVSQYYLFKVGIIKPMVKGIEVEITDGDYVKDIDKFVMKLNDTITISPGDFITIPNYSKDANIWFKVLDNDEIIRINKDKVTSLKEGISSVGVMKDNRVFKKVNIRVIDTKVERLEAIIDNEIKYVGDFANINTLVEEDYDRFKESKPVFYESSDDNIIKVSKNGTIDAVGVGIASINIKAGDKEKVFTYDIQAKTDRIDIAKIINLDIGDTTKLQPKITTIPKGLKHSKISYELVDNKLSIERAISIDKYANVKALKAGSERVRVICGNKSQIITINVKGKSIIEKIIENLQLKHQIIENKLNIDLSWDYIDNVYDYDIYLKNNLEENPKFKVYKSIRLNQDDILDLDKVNASIDIELSQEGVYDLDLYIVGKNDKESTKPSDIINISKENEDIQKEIVENLQFKLSDEGIDLNWSPIKIPNVVYSVYIKDNNSLDGGFILHQNNIEKNEFTILLNDENLNIDVYVVANKDDKYSQKSEIINITR